MFKFSQQFALYVILPVFIVSGILLNLSLVYQYQQKYYPSINSIYLPPSIYTGSSKIPISCDHIDIVYTWVNGSDRNHILNRYFQKGGDLIKMFKDNPRYRDLMGLKYSLRSIRKFAPFIKNIWIVTDNQYPNWIDQENLSNINFVFHDEIFKNKSHLPIFNSNAIESNFYSLPEEVSDCYLYLNDDIFFGDYVSYSDFFDDEFGIAIYPEEWTAPAAVLDGVWQKSIAFSNYLLDHYWNEVQRRNYPTHGLQVWNRQIFQRMYKELRKEMDATSSHRFRQNTDCQIPFLFQQYADRFYRNFKPKERLNFYGIITENIQETRDLYFNITRDSPKTVCLNDRLSDETPDEIYEDLFKFFNTYFPDKAPWEK